MNCKFLIFHHRERVMKCLFQGCSLQIKYISVWKPSMNVISLCMLDICIFEEINIYLIFIFPFLSLSTSQRYSHLSSLCVAFNSPLFAWRNTVSPTVSQSKGIPRADVTRFGMSVLGTERDVGIFGYLAAIWRAHALKQLISSSLLVLHPNGIYVCLYTSCM